MPTIPINDSLEDTLPPTNLAMFDLRPPSLTYQQETIQTSFSIAYMTACQHVLTQHDPVKAFAPNEAFQSVIDTRDAVHFQESQAKLAEVVRRYYHDLLDVVITVVDAEDSQMVAVAAAVAPELYQYNAQSSPVGSPNGHTSTTAATANLFPSASTMAKKTTTTIPSLSGTSRRPATPAAAAAAGSGAAECSDTPSLDHLPYVAYAWSHTTDPLLGRLLVRDGFFMCFWNTTVGERIGQLEHRGCLRVLQTFVSHLHVPLCYHIRYKGRGVTCLGLLPVCRHLTDLPEQDPELMAMAQQVASALCVIPHGTPADPSIVAAARTATSALFGGESALLNSGGGIGSRSGAAAGPGYHFLPPGVCPHVGRDGRYYLLNNRRWLCLWLNSSAGYDCSSQRLSYLSLRLLARSDYHISCRAFSKDAFTLENEAAIAIMAREIEKGVPDLLVAAREAAARRLLRRQKRVAAAELKALRGHLQKYPQTLSTSPSQSAPNISDAVRASQQWTPQRGAAANSTNNLTSSASNSAVFVADSLTVMPQAPLTRSSATNPLRRDDMEVFLQLSSRTAAVAMNPLHTMLAGSYMRRRDAGSGGGNRAAVAAAQRDGGEEVTAVATGERPGRVDSLHCQVFSASLSPSSSFSSSSSYDNAEEANSDEEACWFAEEELQGGGAESCEDGDGEDDNREARRHRGTRMNPFLMDSIIAEFNKAGYPKSLLGVLFVSLLRYPSPPRALVLEVKREILWRGLKAFINARVYEARFGLQQALATVPSDDADGVSSRAYGLTLGHILLTSVDYRSTGSRISGAEVTEDGGEAAFLPAPVGFSKRSPSRFGDAHADSTLASSMSCGTGNGGLGMVGSYIESPSPIFPFSPSLSANCATDTLHNATVPCTPSWETRGAERGGSSATTAPVDGNNVDLSNSSGLSRFLSRAASQIRFYARVFAGRPPENGSHHTLSAADVSSSRPSFSPLESAGGPLMDDDKNDVAAELELSVAPATAHSSLCVDCTMASPQLRDTVIPVPNASPDILSFFQSRQIPAPPPVSATALSSSPCGSLIAATAGVDGSHRPRTQQQQQQHVREARAGCDVSAVKEDFTRVTESVLCAFLQYDGTERPAVSYGSSRNAAAVAAATAQLDAVWSDSATLSSLLIEAVLPFICRKFRLPVRLAEMYVPLPMKDRAIVYERVCTALGVCIEEDKGVSRVVPLVRDFMPESVSLLVKSRGGAGAPTKGNIDSSVKRGAPAPAPPTVRRPRHSCDEVIEALRGSKGNRKGISVSTTIAAAGAATHENAECGSCSSSRKGRGDNGGSSDSDSISRESIDFSFTAPDDTDVESEVHAREEDEEAGDALDGGGWRSSSSRNADEHGPPQKEHPALTTTTARFYLIPGWVLLRTGWLVRWLLQRPEATPQEWDTLGACLVPFLAIQRNYCRQCALQGMRVPSSNANIRGRGRGSGTVCRDGHFSVDFADFCPHRGEVGDARSGSGGSHAKQLRRTAAQGKCNRNGGRRRWWVQWGADGRIPGCADAAAVLLDHVSTMSSAPCLLWHALVHGHNGGLDWSVLGAHNNSHNTRGSSAARISSGRPQDSMLILRSAAAAGLDVAIACRREQQRGTTGDRCVLIQLLRRQAAYWSELSNGSSGDCSSITSSLRASKEATVFARSPASLGAGDGGAFSALSGKAAHTQSLSFCGGAERLNQPPSLGFQRLLTQLSGVVAAAVAAAPTTTATTTSTSSTTATRVSASSPLSGERNCGSSVRRGVTYHRHNYSSSSSSSSSSDNNSGSSSVNNNSNSAHNVHASGNVITGSISRPSVLHTRRESSGMAASHVLGNATGVGGTNGLGCSASHKVHPQREATALQEALANAHIALEQLGNPFSAQYRALTLAYIAAMAAPHQTPLPQRSTEDDGASHPSGHVPLARLWRFSDEEQGGAHGDVGEFFEAFAFGYGTTGVSDPPAVLKRVAPSTAVTGYTQLPTSKDGKSALLMACSPSQLLTSGIVASSTGKHLPHTSSNPQLLATVAHARACLVKFCASDLVTAQEQLEIGVVRLRLALREQGSSACGGERNGDGRCGVATAAAHPLASPSLPLLLLPNQETEDALTKAAQLFLSLDGEYTERTQRALACLALYHCCTGNYTQWRVLMHALRGGWRTGDPMDVEALWGSHSALAHSFSQRTVSMLQSHPETRRHEFVHVSSTV